MQGETGLIHEGTLVSRDLSISSTWYLIRTQEDQTCILIHMGKAVIENKGLSDKTREGNNRTKSSPVMYVKYPSVRYILSHCSINKCQSSSHFTQCHEMPTAHSRPPSQYWSDAAGSWQSPTFPALPEGLLYFLRKPLMQG